MRRVRMTATAVRIRPVMSSCQGMKVFDVVKVLYSRLLLSQVTSATLSR